MCLYVHYILAKKVNIYTLLGQDAMQDIHEKIQVFARSYKGTVRPLQFIWRNQQYNIIDILKSKKQKVGRRVFFYFTVTTLPEGTFELEFDLKTGQWLLLRASVSSS